MKNMKLKFAVFILGILVISLYVAKLYYSKGSKLYYGNTAQQDAFAGNWVNNQGQPHREIQINKVGDNAYTVRIISTNTPDGFNKDDSYNATLVNNILNLPFGATVLSSNGQIILSGKTYTRK